MFGSEIHAYLRAVAGERAHRAGPFLAFFDDHDPNVFRNYAVPDDEAAPGTADIAGLIAAFAARSRTPRLEYLPGVCPRVEPALLAAGFVPETRLPVLTCDPTEAVIPPRPGNVDVLLATTDRRLRQVAEAQNEAYGGAGTTSHDVARLRRVVDHGGLVALAVDTTTGEGVGGGLLGPPHQGVSELAAIGVRASHRGRGVASALTALLTRACAGAGITTPFLTPIDEPAGRVYQRVGYRAVTEMLHISAP